MFEIIQSQITSQQTADSISPNTHMIWPQQVDIASDYSTAHIQSLDFPTLFPMGACDATNKDQRADIQLSKSNSHFLKYDFLVIWKNVELPICRTSPLDALGPKYFGVTLP